MAKQPAKKSPFKAPAKDKMPMKGKMPMKKGAC